VQLSSTLRVTRVSIGSLSLMHDLATCGFAAPAVFALGFRDYRDIKVSSDSICGIAGIGERTVIRGVTSTFIQPS
jgi:hypothetical protein